MAQKVDILLVTPPSRDKVFQDLGENLTGIEPPVWSTLLATFLRKKNISAYLKELGELKLKYQELKSLCIDEIS